VSWDFVDRLIFVSPHIQHIFNDIHKDPVLTSVIPNALDSGKFRFENRRKNKNIAYLGYINFKKNPELLLQCMADLVSRDPGYVLHIAGSYQDLRYKYYFDKMIPCMNLENNVKFHGWVDDVDRWLEDKSIIVSTSVLESFGMGLVEAMAKGIKPVIHNWVGAENIFPQKYLFNTVKDFSDLVLSNDYDSKEYRSYVVGRFDIDIQIRAIENLVAQLVASDGACEAKTSVPETV
jgi:glycosyltransferase involved in cell wall biosynthesis